MRVAILNTFASGGGSAVAANRLSKALSKNNIAVRQYSILESTPVKVTSLREVRNAFKTGIEKAYFTFFEKDPEMRFQFSTAITGFNFTRQRDIRKADIIHLHWFNYGMLSLKGLEKILSLGKPVVWTMHDMWAFTGGCHYTSKCDNYYTSECGYCPMLNNPAKNDLSNKVFQRKQHIFNTYPMQFVTCSHWLGDKAKNSKLLTNQSVSSIPNAIDTNIFSPTDKREAKRSLGIDENKTAILFGAANLNEKRKGFIYLENALRKLKFTNPALLQKCTLVVFGETNIGLLRNLPVKVKNLGYFENPEIAYNAADVFVLPSLEDNLPNTIMEAMSCGTPCVAFKTGGIPEMMDHKKSGYLADYKSIDDIAKGIEWIVCESNYEHLQQEARKKVLDAFAEDLVANQYIELYKKILKR